MRLSLEMLIVMAGVVHLAIAASSLAIPCVLNWREKLRGLDPFMRQLFWVYAGFVWGVNVMFGLILIAQAKVLTSGHPLARWMCAFAAVYWLARLVVQWLVFDMRSLTTRWWERASYHALTVAFIFLAGILGYSALFQQMEVVP
jgi:hypothetical protein